MLFRKLRTTRALPCAAALVAAPLLCVLPLTPAAAQVASAARIPAPVADRLTQPINEKALVSLSRAVHPLANAANDRGLAPGAMTLDRLQLVLSRSAAQETSLRQLIGDLHTPSSASFHKWLTPDQFGQQFGPSDADIATLESWLQSHGFGNIKLNPGGQTLEFSGSAAQFRSTFHAEIHKYTVHGETHYAAASDPLVPAALAPLVGGFSRLNNFRPHAASRLLGKASYNAHAHKATPLWTTDTDSTTNLIVSPGDYAVQYDLNPLYTAGTKGTGQTIAIIDESNIDVSLVNNFRTLFNLPANPPNVIIDGNDPGIDGANNPDGPFVGSSLESYLDVEWAGAVAPNATIDLVIGADTALDTGFVLAAEHAVYANLAPIISLSFGECEASLGSNNQFWNALWSQAAAQGITVMVSTGDSGSAGCDSNNPDYAVYGQAVNGFASTPYNIALGGTDFFYSAYNQDSTTLNAQLATYWNLTASDSAASVSLLGVVPEQPFNNSQYGLNIYGYSGGETTTFAAGGGPSTLGYPTTVNSTTTYGPYPKPSWQSGAGVPADNARDLPDLALFGALGYNNSYVPICAQDGDCQPVSSGTAVQVSGVGGTSVAAPSFAGMMALINQKYGRQGQANYVLYPLAAQFPTAFHDVTTGTNSVPCNITTISFAANTFAPDACIPVSNPATDIDPTYGTATEGQLGNTSTQVAEYNAGPGYDLASGLGSVDANVLVSHWQSIAFTSSTVTLTPSSTTFPHGTAITLSGTVTGSGSTTPTGTVALMTDSTEPLQQGMTTFTLTSGAYSSSVNFLPGGTYNIYGHYSGDATNAAAGSSKTQITVSAENSSLLFGLLNSATNSTSSAAINAGASVPYGTQLLLSGQPVPTTYYSTCVAPSTTPASCYTASFGIPTGSVTFSDSGTAIATATLNASGDAESNIAFAVGSHSVTAKYSGDNSYNASTASAIAFTVTKDIPSITLSSTALTSTSTYQGGQPVTFNFQVENQANAPNTGFYSPAAAPTGSITISGLPTGVPTTGSLVGAIDPATNFPEGIAAITAPASTPAGNYTVTVTYAGDTNYAATSQTFTIMLLAANSSLAPSTTSVTPSATSTSSGTAVTVAVTVTGQTTLAAPTGTVLLSAAGTTIGNVTLTAGSGDTASATIQLNSSELVSGQNILTFQYSGDSVYQPSSTVLSLANNASSGSSSFTLAPSPASLTLSAGSTTTSAITITPSGSFTGNVALACAVASVSGSLNNLPTCSIATASVASSSSVIATLSIASTSSTATGSYLVAVSGTSGSLTASTVVSVSVSAAATSGFTLSATTPAAVAPGATATSTVTVTPIGSFLGTVSLTCAVSPTNLAGTPTCSITQPTALSSSSTSVAATLTVNTSAASTAALRQPANPSNPNDRHSRQETALAALFLGLPLFGFTFHARRRALRSTLGMICVALLALFAGSVIGCGAGTTTAPLQTTTSISATAAGAYAVTITGAGTASGSTTALTQTSTVTITVN